MQSRVLNIALSLLTGAASLALAMHYPLLTTLMTASVVAGWCIFFWRTDSWLLVLPALLPLVGLAPWSGWITFEELDVLILVIAAGGYARLGWQGQPDSGRMLSAGVWLLAGLFALATAVSMYRGFVDAGGFSFGWFQGYHEPMNSIRLAKSFLLALLLLPLWLAKSRQDPARAQRMMSLGLMLGLGTASLTTVWERTAFTGLLNFSSDYRTTGMFWEMHVGGAALDGFLALTVPFALREWMVARSPWRWGLSAAVLGLGAYACLTTFSRGVYLAVPVGVMAFFVLSRRKWFADQVRNDNTKARSEKAVSRNVNSGWITGVLLVVGFGVGAAWMFQSSGYRGMAALLGATALMLPVVHVLRGFKSSQWATGFVASLLLMLTMIAVFWLVPKGAYAAWCLAAIFTSVMLWLFWRGALATSLIGPLALGGFLATVMCTAMVADHWGESRGLQQALPVLLSLLAVCVAAGLRRKPMWPESLRWQASIVGTMCLTAATVGVMGGGAYMTDRFSTGGQDMNVRFSHWQLGRDMLRTPADWWLGKGMGRFPANYFLSGNVAQHPGDYRLKSEGSNNFLTLTGGLHINGWGEIFRVSQRVDAPGMSSVVTAKVRAAKDATLHFEVCEKHLLYSQGCMIKQIAIKGAPGSWQDVRVQLEGNVSRGDWYAPKLLAFSMALESRGGTADVDNVTLTSTDGRALLANGDFSGGTARWFFSSDRHHMPWHIKSMGMNVLFDQGLVGLTLWGLLLAGALWRTSFGKARQSPLAPALAAGLVGFFVVGLFDSLLDVPRVAWLYYMLVLVAMTLPPPKNRAAASLSAEGTTS